MQMLVYLHEMSILILGKNKKNLSAAECAHRVAMVKKLALVAQVSTIKHVNFFSNCSHILFNP